MVARIGPLARVQSHVHGQGHVGQEGGIADVADQRLLPRVRHSVPAEPLQASELHRTVWTLVRLLVGMTLERRESQS